MYGKKWIKEEKKSVDEATDNIIVTFKGNKIKEDLKMWGGRCGIKVRPFITSVKQCFKCFRYGHIKAVCKSDELCIVCTEKAHGRCDKAPKCRNCGGNHKSTYKRCREYEHNKNVHVTMAYHNVSYGVAARILEGNEDAPNRPYDRYEEPEKWPRLQPVTRKSQHINVEKNTTQRTKEIGNNRNYEERTERK